MSSKEVSVDEQRRRASIGTIDAAQASQYQADGFLVVRQVFSADRIAELDAEADRLQQRTDLIDTDNIRCRWQNDVNTGECRFDCFDPVIDLSAVCERTARDPRLLDIVGSAVRRARLSLQGQADLQVARARWATSCTRTTSPGNRFRPRS